MDTDEYDYESLGSNTTMTQNAFAGALAGIAEHCAMYPVDSMKVLFFFSKRSGNALNIKFFLKTRLECKYFQVQQQK